MTGTGNDPLAPFPTIAQREAGQHLDRVLFEGIPLHLRHSLTDWVVNQYEVDELLRRAFSRLRVALLHPRRNCVEHLVGLINKESGLTRPRCDPLDVLNAMLYLHPANFIDDLPDYLHEWQELMRDLDQRLMDSGSAWTVDIEHPGLYRRTDEVVAAAFSMAQNSAQATGRPTAAMHLSNAWRKVYGISPEPTDAYGDAVKAVEAAACPIVLTTAATQRTTTIYRVRDHLRDAAHKWRFVLVHDSKNLPNTGDISPVVELLNRLLLAQTGRHDVNGTTVDYRDSTVHEAQAAVHLAALLVQWFSSGAVQKVQ